MKLLTECSSGDAITSIQYLGGSEVHEYSHESSWDDGKTLLIKRFLSAFTPNGRLSLDAVPL